MNLCFDMHNFQVFLEKEMLSQETSWQNKKVNSIAAKVMCPLVPLTNFLHKYALWFVLAYHIKSQ